MNIVPKFKSHNTCITEKEPQVRSKEASFLHGHCGSAVLMMGKMQSWAGSAKLCFDESGDYILKHSFALQTAVT